MTLTPLISARLDLRPRVFRANDFRGCAATGNQKNSLVSAEGGSLRWVARGVISRETYVRFCERSGVQIPGPTRRRTGNRPPYADFVPVGCWSNL